MSKPNFRTATFLMSAAKLEQLPPDVGIEVAFVGRSNAGKSSVLNQITQNAKLARVSKTPGRTQHINLFTIDKKRRLADLPGYGYAKVPAAIKRDWQETLSAYLRDRACLQGLILVMDIRHPLKEFDENLLTWAIDSELRVHILLNKADKLSSNEIHKTQRLVEKAIAGQKDLITCQPFSATKNIGLKQLRDLLDTWFN